MLTQLNQNTTDLQSILDAVNALPDVGSGGGGDGDTTQHTISYVYMNDGDATEEIAMNLSNVVLKSCDIGLDGGYSKYLFIYCTFDGGIMRINDGINFTLTDCVFSNGGALNIYGGINFTLTNCVFSNGGVLNINGGTNFTITNCQFVDLDLEIIADYYPQVYAAMVAGGNYNNGVLIT